MTSNIGFKIIFLVYTVHPTVLKKGTYNNIPYLTVTKSITINV